MNTQDIIDYANDYIARHELSDEETIDMLVDLKEWCSDSIAVLEEAIDES